MKSATNNSEYSSNLATVPLWIKVAYTIFVFVLVSVYWTNYGPSNFLWFSDVALLITLPAIWLESSLLVSIATVGILLPELIWTIDFFVRLVTGISLVGLSYYMFDPDKPLFLRGLSLFHIFLPILLVWVVSRIGYDKRAIILQTLLTWMLFVVSYLFTDPAKNINLVHTPPNQSHIPATGPLLVLLLMIGYPLLIYLPTHALLEKAFGQGSVTLRDAERRKYAGF